MRTSVLHMNQHTTHNSSTMDELDAIEQELAEIDRKIADLRSRRSELEDYRDVLLASFSDGEDESSSRVEGPPAIEKDYNREDFEWSNTLRKLAKDHWNISQWRDKQLPVMNASLDQRDTFVLMPTGGGKSLCYQLPALVSPGITLVVSPLLSLIRDQAFHLEEASIGVGMLTSNTTKEESKRIMEAMLGPKPTKKDKSAGQSSSASNHDSHPPLKLVYVTPEKISKSKYFMNQLEKVYSSGRLSRIVIDECHCCSNLGHDFRPDYKKLGILRMLFPNTPIMALTATAPPNVVQSVLTTLNLSPVGQAGGTLLFDAPLFRPNLTYKVITRPASNKEAFQFLANYILSKHAGSSGIVYCLSKKDTHVFAEGISEASKGQIATSVYHADVDDYEKERIHERWRDGRIQVVCATIAFGLGINHPNVRIVIHACMAKSLEGYYQESGRAGRDGKPAECLLLYRDQDASRLSTLCISEPEGIKNVYAMISYAQDVRSCRHQLFDVHFSKHQSARLEPCGFCDNCTLSSTDVVTEDIRRDVHSLCTLLNRLKDLNERVTLMKLVEAWKGLGPLRHIALAVRTEQNTAAANNRANKDDFDRIINFLIIKGYLREDFHFTAYATIAYVVNGPRARPFLEKRAISAYPVVEVDFGRDPSRTSFAPGGPLGDLDLEEARSKPKRAKSGTRRSATETTQEHSGSTDVIDLVDSDDGTPLSERIAKKAKRSSSKPQSEQISLTDSDDDFAPVQ